MDLINDSQAYLSGSEKVKYIAIAVCAILIVQVLFKSVKDKLSLLIQLCVIGGLMYFILKYDIQKKKKEEEEFANIDEEDSPVQLKELLNEDKDAFAIYKALLDLRIYNDISYDTSLIRYMEFLHLKNMILHSNSENLKGLYETTDMKIDSCLNELLVVSKNVSDEDSLRIQSAVRKLYKILHGVHMLEIKIHLKEQWRTKEITNTSFPITLEDTKVKGNILTDHRNYNLHYSVY
jgi:hypothetical protein